MNNHSQNPPEIDHVDKPWGEFETLVLNENCTVKIITVRAGEELSLQSHSNRSEWWAILDDELKVEIDGQERIVKRGEQIFIPVGIKHRAIGLGQDCRWLEISFGEFDENDITRYDDKYGRV